MPFGIIVAGDVFQRKLDECFSHIKNLIVIADDIMVIWKNDNHKDHNLAFTTLLQTARRCNVKLNYDKLKFKCTEVNFYRETYTTDGCKPAQNKITAIVKMPPYLQKRGAVFHRYGQLPNKIFTKAHQTIQANHRTY